MLSHVHIGCGQITWRGVDEDQVLAEIAQAGYEGAPAGPRPNHSTDEILARYAAHGLKPAPGYFAADFWKPEEESTILARAQQFADFCAAAGLTELFVATGGFNRDVMPSGRTRWQVAGHVAPEDSMTDAQFAQFARTLNRVGEITLARGVRACFHNHVGSVIETGDEIDRLLSLVDPELIFLGPDTGHLAWAGVDVTAFFRRYADRIKAVHVKDIDFAVRDRGVAAGWDYGTFTEQGIWTEMGRGGLDFPTLFQILAEADFRGWIIVETDVTQLPTPLESAQVSRAYLRGMMEHG